MWKKHTKNIVGKGENAGVGWLICTYKLLYANALNLDKYTFLLFDKESVR